MTDETPKPKRNYNTPAANIVAMSLRDADRCCTCRVCGKVEDPKCTGWGFVCPACAPVEEQNRRELADRLEAGRVADEAHRSESLKAALDVDAARQLCALMSEISEDCWCAGWLTGLEFSLWGMMHVDYHGPVRPAPIPFGQGEVTDKQFGELARLHEKCGGWWFFHDEHGEIFVPTAAWLDMYAEHNRPFEFSA